MRSDLTPWERGQALLLLGALCRAGSVRRAARSLGLNKNTAARKVEHYQVLDEFETYTDTGGRTRILRPIPGSPDPSTGVYCPHCGAWCPHLLPPI